MRTNCCICVIPKIVLPFLTILLMAFTPYTTSAREITLSWDASVLPDVEGYRVFSRQEDEHYDYNNPVWEGRETTCTIFVGEDAIYYFVARAFNSSGESHDLNVVMESISASDSDRDGLTDTEEMEIFGTDPNKMDTDHDGIGDGAEALYWGSNWDVDYDSDELHNLVDADADNDDFFDGLEIDQGFDPSNPASNPNNLPPVAHAGSDQTVDQQTTVILDGSNSFDPDGGIVVFSWTQIAGIAVTLSDPSAVITTFTAPDPGMEGAALTFALTITDNVGLQSTDICMVSIRVPILDDTPMAHDDAATVPENSGTTNIDVIVNDTFGADGPAAEDIRITIEPLNGTAGVNDGGSPNNPANDSIHYTPNRDFFGTDTLTYEICDMDGDCDTAVLTVTVTGVPEMDVKGLAHSIEDGDVKPSVTDHTDFGNADISTGTIDHTFTIENSGSADLNLSGTPMVGLAGANPEDFSVVAAPASPVASGGGTTTFTIRFDPTAMGIRSAEVSIPNDDSDENPYDFSIRGTGDDGDGVSGAEEDGGPNGGDGNGDGTADSMQEDVASVLAATGSGYITAEITSKNSQLKNVQTYTEASLGGGDTDCDYPYGLVSFEIPSQSATLRVYFHNESNLAKYTYKQYGPMPPNFDNPQWYQLPKVTFGTADIGGQTVAYAEYTLKDGGLGDGTGVDGMIYDPCGPGQPAAAIPTMNQWGMIILSLLLAGSALRFITRRRRVS